MAYWLFQGNAKYYRIVDGIRNFEQMPRLVIGDLLRTLTVRLVDVFGNDASATVELKQRSHSNI